jgi:GT2 family glycosyltransferase
MSLKTPPVLLIVFRRPDATRRVCATLRQARPEKLFVAADGPRPNRPDEAEQCREARRIATAVDWPCEVKTLFRDDNLGCGRAVSSAIRWFFDQVEEGIVLEDDCLPEASFFPYCAELLARYRHDTRVMHIAGYNPLPHGYGDGSYYFSRLMQCWGWATWKRVAQHFRDRKFDSCHRGQA